MALFPLSDLLRTTLAGLKTLAVEAVPACVTTVHHDGATAVGNGFDADVSGMAAAGVQITGNATTGNVSFLGSVDGLTFFPVAATRFSQDSVQTTGSIGQGWRIDVRGLIRLRVRLDQVTGGSVTVISRAVA